MRLLLIPAAALALLAAGTIHTQAQTSQTMSSALPSPRNHQVFPAGPAGVQRGLNQVNNSGQVGTVTVHDGGKGTTAVAIQLKGVPAGKTELAGMVRYPEADCNTVPAGDITQALSEVTGGASKTVIPISIDRMLSGNYLVVVYSVEKPSHIFSCGHLYK